MTSSAAKPSSFVLVVTGQVESGYFPCSPSLYVRSSYYACSAAGWSKVAGEDDLSTCCATPANGRFVVDLPLSATFRGTTPYRWPQVIFSCYGMDSFGHDVCRGYGACPIPTVPGSHVREVPCFTPEATSTIQSIVGWITGRRPEFVDPTIVAQEDGREVTKVRTQGVLQVKLNVMIRGTKPMGYDLFPASMQRTSEFPLPEFQALLQKQGREKIFQLQLSAPKNVPEDIPLPSQIHRPTMAQSKKTDIVEESDNAQAESSMQQPVKVKHISAMPIEEDLPRRLPSLAKE